MLSPMVGPSSLDMSTARFNKPNPHRGPNLTSPCTITTLIYPQDMLIYSKLTNLVNIMRTYQVPPSKASCMSPALPPRPSTYPSH